LLNKKEKKTMRLVYTVPIGVSGLACYYPIL